MLKYLVRLSLIIKDTAMKITKLKLENFRGYEKETTIDFSDLTVFVGKNDVGKSTILEALDIFFNGTDACVKLDKDDLNINALSRGYNTIKITVCFKDLPEKIIIDSTNETTLKQEYLLNESEELEVSKTIIAGGKTKINIRALHPTNLACSDLLSKKQSDLKMIIKSRNIACENQTKNAVMRSAIWDFFKDELQLKLIDIDANSAGSAKDIWEGLQKYLPLYTLFQADRKNCDNDSEVQDPLKQALREILADENIKDDLLRIENQIKSKLSEVSNRTLTKLQEISPVQAQSLSPAIPNVKWTEAFKNLSICGDNNIPINKRGSGIKRLVLLSFFMAEADKRVAGGNYTSVIYAIEEPETSQHSANQFKLIDSLRTLANADNTQIILTTHSANIVKKLDFSDLRLIRDVNNEKKVENVMESNLPYPSLNEVNFIAFEELSEEYHNELYGYIEGNGYKQEFMQEQSLIPYKRLLNGEEQIIDTILSTFIRHQIHHPENNLNPRFSRRDLQNSIKLMRDFITKKRNL